MESVKYSESLPDDILCFLLIEVGAAALSVRRVRGEAEGAVRPLRRKHCIVYSRQC